VVRAFKKAEDSGCLTQNEGCRAYAAQVSFGWRGGWYSYSLLHTVRLSDDFLRKRMQAGRK